MTTAALALDARIKALRHAIYASDLPARARLVYLAMLDHSVPEARGFDCTEARLTIAVWTGLSSRSVLRELDTLIDRAWISEEPKAQGKRSRFLLIETGTRKRRPSPSPRKAA